MVVRSWQGNPIPFADIIVLRMWSSRDVCVFIAEKSPPLGKKSFSRSEFPKLFASSLLRNSVQCAEPNLPQELSNSTNCLFIAKICSTCRDNLFRDVILLGCLLAHCRNLFTLQKYVFKTFSDRSCADGVEPFSDHFGPFWICRLPAWAKNKWARPRPPSGRWFFSP